MWRLLLGGIAACSGDGDGALGYTCPHHLDGMTWTGDSRPWVPTPGDNQQCTMWDSEGEYVDGDWTETSDDFICEISQFSPLQPLVPGTYTVDCGDLIPLTVSSSGLPLPSAGYVSVNLHSGARIQGYEVWGSVQFNEYGEFARRGGWLQVQMLDAKRFLNEGFIPFELDPVGTLDVLVTPVGPDGELWASQRLAIDLELR